MISSYNYHKKHHFKSDHHSKFWLVKKIIFKFSKFVGFSIFTIITGLPLVLYLYMATVPAFASTLNLIYYFDGSGLFWYIIVPNIGYVIMWFITVSNILRGRAKWWYYLILLIFGIVNWWEFFRVIALHNLLGSIFGV